MFSKCFKSSIIAIFLTFFSLVAAGASQSLYVVSHYDHYLRAFAIEGNQLVFQHQILLDSHNLGPIDLAIDNEDDVLFVSYENVMVPSEK